MSEWVEIELGNIAEVKTGPFGSALLNNQYIKGGTPIITVEHIKDFRICQLDYPSVSEEDKKRLSSYVLKEGDLVFSRVGSVDLSAITLKENEGWLFSSRMLRVRPNRSKINPLFLSYYLQLKSVRQFIRNIAVGSTMPSINTEILKSIPIRFCTLPEQSEIAFTLSNLDSKITLLRQQNQTLEELAQTLFKRWFVDFEFPNENGEPFKSSGGKMIDSELGEIPEGWKVQGLTEIADYMNGLACQKFLPQNEDDKLPVLKIRELNTGITENSDFASKTVPTKYVIKNGDIIFSWSGTLVLKIWDGEECVLNQHLFKVTSNQYPDWFIYQWTLKHLQNFISIAASKATTMGHIKRSHLDESLCLVPDSDMFKKIDLGMQTLINTLRNNNKEIKTYIGLRDTLLPKLMSGEIEIK